MFPIYRLVRLIVVAALPLVAHHPFSDGFDEQKLLTLTGTIASVKWINPHVRIFLDVKNAEGKTERWELEAARPSFLINSGIPQRSLARGTTVTVEAYASRRQDHHASARHITIDGKRMEAADPQEDGGPERESRRDVLAP
jgi:hypothetical protein